MNEANDFKFVRRTWNIVNNELNANYSVGNKTIYGTEVSKSNLFDYKDANILLRGYKTIPGNNLIEAAFKNCASLTRCTKKKL